MDVKQLDEVRKLIAHHCQEAMVTVMKEIDTINPTHHRTENAYEYLARYKQELRTKLQINMRDKWWGREQ